MVLEYLNIVFEYCKLANSHFCYCSIEEGHVNHKVY